MWAVKWLGDPGKCFVGCADLIEPIIIHLLSLSTFAPGPLSPPSSSSYTVLLFARLLDMISYLFVCSPLPHLLPPPSFSRTHTTAFPLSLFCLLIKISPLAVRFPFLTLRIR